MTRSASSCRGRWVDMFTEEDDLVLVWPGTERLLSVRSDHGCTR